MEAPQSLFWSIPSEIIVSIFSLLPFRSIINFETADKTQSQQFNERELYKHLSCNLFHWGPNDIRHIDESATEKINWRAEFIISSIHYTKILANELHKYSNVQNESIDNFLLRVGPNHYQVLIQDPDAGNSYNLQSKIPLYPHPLGDFTVAYYEVKLLSCHQTLNIYIGAALENLASLAGVSRNSFSYSNDGELYLELDIAPTSLPSYKRGDTVGFGIDFQSRAVFWTLNGQLVCSRTHNYWHEPLLNLDTLHAVVSCHQGFEFSLNFGSSPFMFDIIKYQRHRDNQAIQFLNNNKSNAICYKQTYSIVMLNQLKKYIEEDTLAAIDNRTLRTFCVYDSNSVRVDAPMNNFWRLLTFPRGPELRNFHTVETLTVSRPLLLEWKEDKGVQFILNNISEDIRFDELHNSYEDFITKIRLRACDVFVGTLHDLIRRCEHWIRDEINGDSSSGWALVVTAYKFLITSTLPVEHSVIQRVFSFLNKVFCLGLEQPFTRDKVDVMIVTVRQCIMGLRHFAIKRVIMKKNELKKNEFEKRNAWLKELYSHRITVQEYANIISDAKIPTTEPKQDLVATREEFLVINMFLLDRYEELDEENKTFTLVHAIGLFDLSINEQIASEADLIAYAKVVFRLEISNETIIDVIDRVKARILAQNSNADVLFDYAFYLGLDASELESLTERVLQGLDKVIKKYC